MQHLNAVLRVAVAALLLLGTAGYLGESGRMLELASHFRPQYLLAGCVLLAIATLRRQPGAAAAAAVVIALNAYSLAPPPSREAAAGREAQGAPLRLMLANVQFSNDAHEAFRALVADRRPDIVVVEELTPAWAGALAALASTYPHGKMVPRSDPFGIGLLSRRRLGKIEMLNLGHPAYPALLARIPAGNRMLSLLATHPPPPVNDLLFRVRNAQLQELARLASRLPPPAVILGDLNLSPWSPYFQALLEGSGLINARDGFGILPTWPSFFPPAMIPIDHCLISPAAKVKRIETGPNIGSDHLPVLIDLLVRNAAAPAFNV